MAVNRPRERGLNLHAMDTPNEVPAVPEYERAGPFEPPRYDDEYQKRLEQRVESKSEGTALKATPERRPAPVIDPMQALQKSPGQMEMKPAGTPKRPAAGPRRARRQKTQAEG